MTGSRHARRIRTYVCTACVAVLALACCGVVLGQTAGPAPNSQTQVLHHLNLALHWSRQWESTNLYLSRPDDELYVENGRRLARQVVELEFESALAQAALIGHSSPQQTPPVSTGTQNSINIQNIHRFQQQIDQRVQELKKSLDAVNQKIAHARGDNRTALETQRDTLQGRLNLAQALQDNLEKLASFMTSAEIANGAATELSSKILGMRRTALGAEASPGAKSSGKTHSTPKAPVVNRSGDQGLVGQFGEMFRLLESLRVLNKLKTDAAELQISTRDLRAPLLEALRSTLQQSQIALGGATQPPTSGSGIPSANAAPVTVAKTAAGNTSASTGGQPKVTPDQEHSEMQALLRRFKLLSSATLPLSQEIVLVDQSQANLRELQAAIEQDYFSALRTLLIRVIAILIALGVIWLLSRLWRRATFRYIRDARRRRQFLVLSRTVAGICMVIIVVLGFVSDFSSLATYAGLITAGVAVALQAIILSVAAYFFIIGRYGIRVGDRITVTYNAANAVTGDVVDIGLVRFYLMELAGTGIDMQPTGRICAFPNSVLFASNPLFKQIPGTEYAWREIALPLTEDSDANAVEAQLLATVEKLYSTYRPALERQHLSIESSLNISIDTPKPYTRRRFGSSGQEVVVRYPIPLRQATELDDRMVMEVTELLRKNPSIRLVAGAAPILRTPIAV